MHESMSPHEKSCIPGSWEIGTPCMTCPWMKALGASFHASKIRSHGLWQRSIVQMLAHVTYGILGKISMNISSKT
eukprot:scaffold138521_cov18-Prasinocladus_malaysianus.AAC.1